MGVDFIRRARGTFHKGIDRTRMRMATPTLFTQQPESSPRIYAAHLCGGETASTGETLGFRLEGGKVCAMRGLDRVATIENPPAELLDALLAGYGEACGVVEDVHDLAGRVEVSVC